MWTMWVLGGVVLVAAGAASALAPRLRARDVERRRAWSSARAAIDAASVSRDASPVRVEEAERLLTRAETVAADRGGADAASSAQADARRADLLWREAAGG